MRSIQLAAVFLFAVTAAQAQELKSRLGVEIYRGGAASLAHPRETARRGDQLLVVAQPSQDSYLYVVLLQGGTARLLNPTAKLSANSAAAFPSQEQLLALSAAGMSEIHIYLSASALSEMDDVRSGVSAGRFREIDAVLRAKAGTQSAQRPAPVAANVRSMDVESLAARMPVYSHSTLITARFYIDVKE